MQRFTLGGLIARFAASVVLVLATYNPTGRSYIHWVAGVFPHLQPLQAVVGIALTGLWMFFLHATWRSLGTVGVVLGLAFASAAIWLFSSWGWFSLSNTGAMTWAALLVLACLLTVGLCWALIEARVSGQAVVENVNR